MANPLANYVTRPDSYDPTDDYAVVVARGDHPIGDYDLNDMQAMLRADLAELGGLLLREGAVIIEAGGTIGVAQVNLIIGGDAVSATGVYVGAASQVYTISIITDGASGAAQFTFSSTGTDNPSYVNQPFPIPRIAATTAAGLADLATYGVAVGAQGLVVVFANSALRMHAGSGWTIQATYGARPPVVAGTTITVADLLVLMSGKVQRVKGATLTYAAASSGVAVVYGEWSRYLITTADDPDLVDPLSNEGQGYRERWRMVLQSTDTSGLVLPPNVLERRVTPLYRWDRATNEVTTVDPFPYLIPLEKTVGALPAARLVNVDKNKLLLGMLAVRTYYAHGSFVSRPTGGLARAMASTNTASPGKVRLVLPPIHAYIEGVQFISDNPQDIELDQGTDVATVLDETKTFTGANTYTLSKFSNGFPIAAIQAVTADVQVTSEPVTRGATDDLLLKTPVISVQSVVKGADTYTVTTNYTVLGDTIHWVGGTGSAGGAIPGVGTSYNVTYRYRKQMTPTTDYVLNLQGAVDFSPAGDNPVNPSNFDVDYTYYLWRTDALVIRPTGEIVVVRGIPQATVVRPTLPQYVLPYCLVQVSPGLSALTVKSYNNDALTFEDLCNMRDELRRRLIDVARLDLNCSARSKIPAASNPNDVVTDAFNTRDTSDEAYNTAGITYDATLDVGASELTLPFTQQVQALTQTSTPTGVAVRVGTNFFSIPYGDERAIDAPRWSTDYPVNPYADFRPEPPVLTVTPDRDYWIDTISLSNTQVRIVQNNAHENANIVDIFSTNQTSMLDIPFLQMRAITLIWILTHLVPNEKIKILFGGKVVPLSAQVGTTVDGTTVAATSTGDWQAFGTLPVGVPTGTALVEAWGDSGMVGSVYPANYTRRATCLFSSEGTLRIWNTQTIITAVQNDPVAQSWVFPAPRMISKVVVPIAAVPAGTVPLVCEIRATDRSGDASSPTQEVLGRVSKTPAGWSGSNVATFGDPIYQPANEFRALVMRAASNQYRVYVSQLGGADRVSGGFITSQQIDSGIFMDSSNNSDWTLRQDWDLRCEIWVAKMTGLEAWLYYGAVAISGGAGTAFMLNVDQVVPDACGITWSYTINAGVTWTEFLPATLTELPSTAATLQVRARLWTTSLYVTPFVHRRNAMMVIQSNKTAGRYITRARATLTTATGISGQVDALLPTAAANFTVEVSANNGTNWIATTKTAKGTAADGFTVYEFVNSTAVTSSNPAQMRIRINLTTTNAAVRPRIKRLYGYAI